MPGKRPANKSKANKAKPRIGALLIQSRRDWGLLLSFRHGRDPRGLRRLASRHGWMEAAGFVYMERGKRRSLPSLARMAIIAGNESVARGLLARPRFLDDSRGSLLVAAARKGMRLLVADLLEYGESPNRLSTLSGPSVLLTSLKYAHFDTALCLLRGGATVAAPENRALYTHLAMLIARGMIKTITAHTLLNALSRAGGDINCRDGYPQSITAVCLTTKHATRDGMASALTAYVRHGLEFTKVDPAMRVSLYSYMQGMRDPASRNLLKTMDKVLASRAADRKELLGPIRTALEDARDGVTPRKRSRL